MTFHLNIGAEASLYIDLCVFNFVRFKPAFIHHAVKIKGTYRYGRVSLIAKSVKDLLAMQETQVRSLSQQDHLENGNPLQYFCLENPMDRGAWQTTAYGVTRVGHKLASKLPDMVK